MTGAVPQWLLTAFVVPTVFAVMLGIGLGVVPGELRRVWQAPAPMLRGLFAVLVAVPALALAITRVLDLPRPVEVGIVLMAISPGAPVALRSSVSAGGQAAFAPSLQMSVALLAVASMPLWLAALEQMYAAHASISPWDVMRQVFIAQLLPLGLGIGLRNLAPSLAERMAPGVRRAATALLLVTLALVVVEIWQPAVRAGLRSLAAIALTTVAALAAGHLLGGRSPGLRTSVAIASAARNPGLALLVATLNGAPPAITAAILAYLAVSVPVIGLYALWRRYAGAP